MTQVTLKRSSVASKVPLIGDLALGEIAINTYDGKLFIKKNDGSDSIVDIGKQAEWGSITGTISNQIDISNAINAKQNTLVSGTTIKTINGLSVMGSGDLTVSATPGGSTGQIQYNSSGSFAGASNVGIDNGDITILASLTTVNPPANTVKIFGKNISTRIFPAFLGPSGLDAILQPSAWRQKIGLWNPAGNSTGAPGVFGMVSPTTVGTATTRTVATTNLFTRTRRLGYVSFAIAGALCGHYSAAAQYTTGNGSGLGGIFYSCRFAISDASTVGAARSFIGLSSSVAAPTNVQPNTLTNSIGIAQLSTDATQLYLVYGGSAAQTAIALGTNFPPQTGSGATTGIVYDFSLFSSPNSNGIIGYRIERVGTSFVAEGTLTPATPGVQTPISTTLLGHRAWRCNNTTAAAVGLDIITVYTETDY